MLRTLNYTSRRKLLLSEFKIHLNEHEDTCPDFDIDFSLEPGLPGEAEVIVEAYYRNTLQRFAWGTIENISPPRDRELDQIDLSGSVSFRILISANGKILASRDRLKPDVETTDGDGKKESLMVVVARDLGEVVWRVDIEADNKPELVINKKIPYAIESIRSDVMFRSLIIPAAFKQVLLYYLWNDSIDDDSNEEAQKWFEMAKEFGGELPESRDPYDSNYWVDEVVREFSKKFNFVDSVVRREGGKK